MGEFRVKHIRTGSAARALGNPTAVHVISSNTEIVGVNVADAGKLTVGGCGSLVRRNLDAAYDSRDGWHVWYLSILRAQIINSCTRRAGDSHASLQMSIARLRNHSLAKYPTALVSCRGCCCASSVHWVAGYKVWVADFIIPALVVEGRRADQ